MPALKVSYDFLPSHLQRCFSYCALFPEDHKFDSKELIHWWIGLDILQSTHQNKSLEDIGESNLKDLVNHGFIKKDETNERSCFIIHDLLHDLGLKVTSRECLSIDHSNLGTVEIWPSVRHLSIIMDGNVEITARNFTSELRIVLEKN
uniref:Disease resistance protein winged helix domain-containing protein n=1 Tax=Arundo donax TaxID=35708 RepID=A0A0A9CXK3_ARUDO